MVFTAAQVETQKQLKEHLLKCLAQYHGVITTACMAANLDRKTYYNWCDSDPEFAKRASEMTEVAKDFVESKLYQNIEAGDVATCIFYAKTKMKDRGYIERQEITGANGGAIQVETTLPEAYQKLLDALPVQLVIEDKKS